MIRNVNNSYITKQWERLYAPTILLHGVAWKPTCPYCRKEFDLKDELRYIGGELDILVHNNCRKEEGN